MKKNLIFLLLFLGILLYPQKSQAVIPPDFIFNIGSQVLQFFSALIIFFSAIFGLCYEFLRTKMALLKHRRVLLFCIGLLILITAFGFSVSFATLKQNAEYNKWLAESEAYSQREEVPDEEPVTEPSPLAIPPLPPTSTLRVEISSSTPPTNFFEENTSLGLSITNQDFKNVLSTQKNDSIIIDAREDIEFANGHFPGALHIRYADLKDGAWETLPKNKVIYVFCWSGIRGKEVAEFLRTKNLVGVFLEHGANGWYDFGGTWQGNIKFAEKYTDLKFQKVFTTDEVKKHVKEGVVLVDSREPERFNKSHIKNSISIPLFYTPTRELESTFAKVPAGSSVITICDGYVNCFDAKLTGVELEKRGYTFLGRYNTPWDYGN